LLQTGGIAVQSIYNKVTSQIISQLLTVGPHEWNCPWYKGASLPRNAATSHAYRGINTLTLWSAMVQGGYSDYRWATYRQWSHLGAQVRKGERGSLCVFYKAPEPAVSDLTGSKDVDAAEEGSRSILRVSRLFNAEQVEGAAEIEDIQTQEPLGELPPHFTRFVEVTGAKVIQRGNTACFIPGLDEIHMPARELFHTTSGYITTLCHELTHWTGAKHRLDRDLSGRFGSQSYAAEELVAELGSAFLPASLGLGSEPPPNHAAYIANWLPLLQADPRALFSAASLASRAVDWLLATAGCSATPI